MYELHNGLLLCTKEGWILLVLKTFEKYVEIVLVSLIKKTLKKLYS